MYWGSRAAYALPPLRLEPPSRRQRLGTLRAQALRPGFSWHQMMYAARTVAPGNVHCAHGAVAQCRVSIEGQPRPPPARPDDPES